MASDPKHSGCRKLNFLAIGRGSHLLSPQMVSKVLQEALLASSLIIQTYMPYVKFVLAALVKYEAHSLL